MNAYPWVRTWWLAWSPVAVIRTQSKHHHKRTSRVFVPVRTPLLSLFFGRSYNQRTLFRRLVVSIFREIFLQKVHFSLLNLHQNTNHCLCNPVSVLVGNFPAISSAFSAFFSTSCLATECLFFFLVLHHWVLLPAGGANRIQRQRVQSWSFTAEDEKTAHRAEIRSWCVCFESVQGGQKQTGELWLPVSAATDDDEGKGLRIVIKLLRCSFGVRWNLRS